MKKRYKYGLYVCCIVALFLYMVRANSYWFLDTSSPVFAQAMIWLGADVNAKNRHDNTVFWQAVDKGRDDFIDVLLNSGVEINGKTALGTNFLVACTNAKLQTVKRMIEYGADVKAKYNGTGSSVFLRTLRFRADTDVLELLLEHGSKVSERDKMGRTALILAMKHNRPYNIAEFLIDNGADVNATDINGYTALMVAVKEHYDPAVVKLLLERGAKVNATNKWNRTALLIATNYEDVPYDRYEAGSSMIHELVQAGADPNIQDTEIDDAALLGVAKHSELVKLLVEHGADVNIKNKYGITPLMYAAHRSNISGPNVDSLVYLLSKGADVLQIDSDGRTALDHATDCYVGYDDRNIYPKDCGSNEETVNILKAAMEKANVNNAKQPPE